MNFFKINPAPFYFKLAMIMVGVLSLGYLTSVGKEVLCPLVFGLLFSILLFPLCKFLEKKLRLPRGAAAGLSVVILILAIASLLFVIGSQLTSLAQDWPQFKDQLMLTLHNLQNWIAVKFHVDLAKQMAYIDTATSHITNQTTTMIGATVVSVSSIVLFLVFIMIDTFFLLFYRRLFLKFFIKVFKEENSSIVLDIVEQVQFIMRKYILGLLLEMSIVAGVCCTVFLILGIKYAILLGLITGLFNIIPYIGIFTALLLNIIITFATAAASAKILLVLITVICMHLIDSNILLPVIVGSKVRINPFITLIGVIVGEMIWGIPGMFLSIPTIAIAKIIFDRVETLEPWGMLLGDDEIMKDPKKILAKTYRKMTKK
ncbi:MAG: AI-2E family transporter [Bacteroidota bacterium]|nr:AI-2E family transporter [Bacteroidota bacterium]